MDGYKLVGYEMLRQVSKGKGGWYTVGSVLSVAEAKKAKLIDKPHLCKEVLEKVPAKPKAKTTKSKAKQTSEAPTNDALQQASDL